MIFPFLASMSALRLEPPRSIGDPGTADLGGADLVEQLRRGDLQALGRVYDEHHEAVRAFASRLIGDAAIAEDLVHDVFVALPGSLQSYRGDSSLRSFLIGVAINQARHHVRSASRRRAAVERLGSEPERQSRSPEAIAEERRFVAAVERALDGLPLEQRVAFVLCEVEERSAAEAAAIVGAPEATLRTRLFHARKKLQAALEKAGLA
jgi:RNA polymerase sigma-70 factor (ECF subfamily)